MLFVCSKNTETTTLKKKKNQSFKTLASSRGLVVKAEDS